MAGTQGQTTQAQNQLAGWGGFTPYQAVGSGDQSQVNQNLGAAQNYYQGPLAQGRGDLQQQAQNYFQGANLGQYGPVGPSDLSGAQGTLGQVGGQYGQAQLGSLQGFGSDTQQARQQLGSLLSGNLNAPNRGQIAADALKTFDEQQRSQEQLGVQDIGRNAAASGRLGSGMVSTSLGDLQSQLNQQRNQFQRGLAGDVASQTLNDRLAQIQAAQGVTGQLGGLDLSQAGLGLQAGSTAANLALQRGQGLQSLAGQQAGLAQVPTSEAMANRAFGAQQGMNQAQLGLQQGGALAGLAGQQFGESAAQAAQRLQQGQALQGLGGQQFGESQANAQNRLAQAGLLANLQQQGYGQSADQANRQLQQGNAFAGLAGQQFGQGQTLLGNQRLDQQLGLQGQQANLAGQQGILGQLSGLEGQQYGQQQQNFGNLLNERGYQQALDQQALQNKVQQFGLEQGAQQQAFTQNQDVNQLLASLGFGGSTDSTLGDIAGMYAGQGADLQGGAGSILRNYFAGLEQPIPQGT